MEQTSQGRHPFNTGWEFKYDDTDKHGEVYSQHDWHSVTIPHDWSIKKGYDKEYGDGSNAYLTGGLGYYKKSFNIENPQDKVVYIHFDGVYNNSEYILNGQELGKHPYGYSPFYFNIGDKLKSGENLLEVNVDRRRYVDSRWYPGSGIYRTVELQVLNKIHIPVWGTFVKTPNIFHNKADIYMSYQVANCHDEDQTVTLEFIITGPHGKQVSKEARIVDLTKGLNQLTYETTIKNPQLWGIYEGNQYDITVNIHQSEQVLDTYTTRFGIREFHFDVDKGFYLNGDNMKIKGVCLHNDCGLVGAAVPKDVWRRRLLKLKKMGCNAIRGSHNPSSKELLDLCDEMGFLFQEEFFDEWDGPKDKRLNMGEQHDDFLSKSYSQDFLEWSELDLKNSVLCHRNHPSIFQWSIGNEIEWGYPRFEEATRHLYGDFAGQIFSKPATFTQEDMRKELLVLHKEEYDMGETAKRLAKWTKQLDTTRSVTANCVLPLASLETTFTDDLDVVGLSYMGVHYDALHKNYPEKTFLGTENWGQYHDWKAIVDRDFISGIFIWTGVAYLGEVSDERGNVSWPMRDNGSGLLDVACFERAPYHMFKSLWNDDAHVYIATQTEELSTFKQQGDKVVEKEPGKWQHLFWKWPNVNPHWNYPSGEKIIAEVYSNCDEVELYLNNQSLGKQSLSDYPDNIYKWAVPFKSGELKAIGYKNGKQSEYKIVTASETQHLKLSTDRSTLKQNSEECSHIVVELLDAIGNKVYTCDEEIEFTIDGEITRLGVDNGSPTNVSNHDSNKIQTSQGQALLILQESGQKGEITITANLTKNPTCTTTLTLSIA